MSDQVDRAPQRAPATAAAAAAAVQPEPIDPAAVPAWLKRAIVWALAMFVAFQVGLWAFGQLHSFWFVLAFAFFFSLVMEPPVAWLARHGWRRGSATGLVMGGFMLAAVVFFAIFGQLLLIQLAQLVAQLPDLFTRGVDWVNATFNTKFDANTLLNKFNLTPTQIADLASQLGLGILGLVTRTIGLVFQFFTVLLFAFYLTAEGPRFRRTVGSWMPAHRQRVVMGVWEISEDKAAGYVISRAVLAAISAAAHCLWFLVIGLPYWLPLGLWVGIVSQFIPTIGTYLAGALPIVIALVSGDVWKAVLVLGFVLAYQQLENYFIAPRITQTTLEVHAAIAFGSVIVGAALFGAPGALLAIPVVAVVLSILDTYGHRYEIAPELAPKLNDAAVAAVEGEPADSGPAAGPRD